MLTIKFDFVLKKQRSRDNKKKKIDKILENLDFIKNSHGEIISNKLLKYKFKKKID